MEHDIVDLYCPKCDERTTCVVGRVDMDKPLACGNCGRVTRWGSLRTASGIRLEDHSKVFELFKRAGSTTDIPGEGMGMSYVQTILRRHGGLIWLESELGKGTTFYFSIPHQVNKERNDV